jgi:WD40 repeat protein
MTYLLLPQLVADFKGRTHDTRRLEGRGILFTPDGKQLVTTGSLSGEIRFWDVPKKLESK